MKKIIIILVSLCALLAVLLGCPVIPVTGISAETRISLFSDELNNTDRSNMYTQFHPDTESYDQIKDPEYFDGTPLSTVYIPFSISITEGPFDIGGGQQQVEAIMYRDNSVLEDPCTFIMQMDGPDWYIREFTLGIFEILKIGVTD